MKKLTLVTVTFNSRHTLYDTINSVLHMNMILMNVYDGFQKKMMDFMML